ncbi:MAG: hypothetical protein IPL49_01500 [Saprospirales bacterium]|nr:hypothetical protein [Saprospirales bacterium]MBK8489594.1 hypothetical protein [Saprospirales bacterium]
MKISVEISLYPLQEAYETPILEFIGRLRTYPDLVVRTNSMSTQIFGEYETLTRALIREIKTSFESGIPSAMVMKWINIDVR